MSGILNTLPPGAAAFVERACEITLAGGNAMWAIWLVAFLMCALGANVWIGMTGSGMRRRSRRAVERWVKDPSRARGAVGRLVKDALGSRCRDAAALTFAEYKADALEPFERQLKIMKLCVGVAPLLGLFGTVTGMLATFAALASGSGGEQTMGDIAKGISEALITTEAGLVVALPGLFFHYYLSRKLRGYQNFLDDAESLCLKGMRSAA
jgi:biopolymer transport protein ExbB